MEERVIVVGQRTVMVRDAGDPDGAAVIYFHGSPGSRLDVQLAEQHAEADRVRLISFDRPGYGGSEPGSFGLHQMALHAESVADQLSVGSFAALGWSGGGPFALATAAVLGDRVSRVGLACAPGPFQQVPGALDGLDESSLNALCLLPDDPDAAAAQFSVGSELLLSVRDDETTFMDGMEALFGNADRSVVSDPLLRHHLFVTMHEGLKQGFGGVAWDNIAWVGPWDVDLHAVRCPVHLWYGEADQSIPLVHGEWLAEHLYDTHLVVEPGAGHLWPLRRFPMMLRTITAAR